MSDSETEAGFPCPACGTANDPAARFCQECGSPLAAPPGAANPAPGTAAPAPNPSPDLPPAAEATPERVPSPASRPAPTVPLPGPAPASATTLVPPAPPTPDATPSPPVPSAPDPTPPSTAPRPAARAAADRDGNWLTVAPPRSVLLVGLILFLGACLLLASGQDALSDPLEPLLFCAGPVGLLLVAVALLRLLAARRR